MAFEALMNLGSAAQSGGSGLQSITGALGDIFGRSSAVKDNTSGSVEEDIKKSGKGKTTEGLQIDEVGIQKLLQDVLGSQQGLASVFSADKVSGLYGSTVSAQASGNLLANLAGEIAKLTAKKVSETEEDVTSSTTQKTAQTSKQETSDDGLLGQVKDLFGF